jgi:formate--tetrahydrofolate ligase
MSDLLSVAAKLDIPASALEPYGHDKAKLTQDFVTEAMLRPRGKLVLVTAINPTPAGEGKTTTTIGLGDALARAGRRVAIALREPSLGPCFGVKGGATGGGRARIEPADDINLHFTGDFHAVTAAHNLLAALIDNSLQQGNPLGLDPRSVTWRRVLDMNDRALRHIVIGLGGTAGGVVRETGFDITAASEIMAILCLAQDAADLRARLDRIVIGWKGNEPVHASALKSTGALMALLKHALKPNLVATAEGTPTLVHGGPFANIAHGCNSLIATRTALGLADWVVTEAGFGADLGAEKFLNIKCRVGGLEPSCIVLVATVRALKYNGGAAVADLNRENLPALEAGMPNLFRHVNNLQDFHVPVVVALNRFGSDTDAEVATVQAWCKRNFIACIPATHYTEGGAGAAALAEAVEKTVSEGHAFAPLYPDDMPLLDKVRLIARKVYHAEDIDLSAEAVKAVARFEAAGFGNLPVCIAKTQYSFSDDPARLGAPRGFRLLVRSLRLSAGAGFVVVQMGDILLMPGLPATPASERIDLADDGRITGLMAG